MKFAAVDKNGAPLGFYEDAKAAPKSAVEISDDIWQQWLADQTMRLQSGTLVSVPSQPNAGQIFASKLAEGIQITSTGTQSLSATYALDDLTLAQIGSIARDAASGLGLPGGGNTFSYPDISGVPKSLSAANVQALYKAMRDLVWQLNTQFAVLAQGGTPSWPAQTATIA